MWHWSADTLFDSHQLTITWMYERMSTIKLTQIVYAFDMWLVMSGHYKKIMPGHYKKTANQSAHTIVAT